MDYRKHDRVFIVPISENGTVETVREDSRGEPIIEVVRDSDKQTHLCRESELRRAP